MQSLKGLLNTFLCTDTSNLEEEPELFLSLHLHLHHSRLRSFDVRDCRLQLWKQVDDATLTHQNCTVGATRRREVKAAAGERTSRTWRGRRLLTLPYLRCVYRSFTTLSWFWTIWSMIFKMSELSLYPCGGSGPARPHANTQITVISATPCDWFYVICYVIS